MTFLALSPIVGTAGIFTSTSGGGSPNMMRFGGSMLVSDPKSAKDSVDRVYDGRDLDWVCGLMLHPSVVKRFDE